MTLTTVQPTVAPSATPKAWHIRATRLPHGRQIEEWWIVDGRLSAELVLNAADLPGGRVMAGLVNAHVHLTLDFAQTGLRPGSAELMTANFDKRLFCCWFSQFRVAEAVLRLSYNVPYRLF